MKKYDYDIKVGIDHFSSLGFILGFIPQNSTVLEFGCSYGYMTKFMKEQLNCKVSVVEIDSEAYKEARQYAEDGVCCNIDTLEWADYFKADSFDVIVFADVFEHLRSPSKALQSTKKLLKEDGTLLFSVPNLAHSDVLSNLYDNRFQYTPLGLLDDTHIHFFTYRSLEPFAGRGGYSIVEEKYTYKPPFSTEQAEFIPECRREFLEGMMADHVCGDVYQFVCKLQKKEYVSQHQIEKKSSIGVLLKDEIESTVFFDYGEGFHPQDSQAVFQPHRKDRTYDYHLTIPAGTRAVRLDPIEREKCAVQEVRLKTDDPGKVPDIVGSNGVYCCGAFLFDTIDPQIYIDFKGEQLSQLDVTLSMIRMKEHPWHEFADLMKNSEGTFQNALAAKERQLAVADGEMREKEEELSERTQELAEAEQKLSGCQAELERLREEHQKILDSRWWKVTAPLRKLTGSKI